MKWPNDGPPCAPGDIQSRLDTVIDASRAARLQARRDRARFELDRDVNVSDKGSLPKRARERLKP